jgi:hypothetical protein
MNRRSVLRGGAVIGLSTVAGLRAGPAVAALRGSDHLVPDYRASQPTGWPWTPGRSFGATLGGHRASQDFTYNGRACRVDLNPADPAYGDVPTGGFRQVLDETVGNRYTFRYHGGFRGGTSWQSSRTACSRA